MSLNWSLDLYREAVSLSLSEKGDLIGHLIGHFIEFPQFSIK